LEQLIDKDYKKLLNKYTALNNDNEQKKKAGVHDYSIMNALLKKTDEVNLHSNFIYSMINPKSSHYCGTIFLELFLESINESNFINLSNARVHKEKGKVDLLIEDGEKVIIIENKLRAVDQQHQISRYIQYVYDKYIDKNTTINDKIHVVYLSEYKKTPSKEKKSTIGFDELNHHSKELVWQGNNINLCNGSNLSLPNGTRLRYNRVQHSVQLLKWVFLAKDWLSQNKPNNISQGLKYAFDEYRLILKRLDTKKPWRNLMSLDQYTLDIKDEEEQEKMYVFMCEANKKLNDFIAKRLDESLNKLFPISDRNKFSKFEMFTKEKLLNWLNKKGTKKKYQDVCFEIVFNENKDKKFVFALGIDNIAYAILDKNVTNDWWDIKTNRNNLQLGIGKNLFDVINDLENIHKQLTSI